METVNLIVYGTLMRGKANSHLCRNATFISLCKIKGTLYKTGWGYPAFVPGGKGVVKAEFVVLPESDWPAIERLEGYPTLYDRRKIGNLSELREEIDDCVAYHRNGVSC